jgi:hypothetical protein
MKACLFKAAVIFLVLLFLLDTMVYSFPLQNREDQPPASRNNNQNSSQKDKTLYHPRTLRAIASETLLLGSSTAQYWSNYNKFTVDWQFTWKTFGRKFFTAESPRFDSNAFYFNWSHAWAGAGYYSMARINGLNNRSSFLFSLTSAALWETVIEWREIISLNDLIFTSFGGPAIGEPLYQISSYFSNKEGALNYLAGFVFNPFLYLNNLIDYLTSKQKLDYNSAPLPAWHYFVFYLGLQQDLVTPSGSQAVAQSGLWNRWFTLGFDLATQTLDTEKSRNNNSGFYSDTLASSFSLDLAFSQSGLEEINGRTAAVLFGWNWFKNKSEKEGETAADGSYFLGYGVAFELFKKRAVSWYDSRHEVPPGEQVMMDNARLERPRPTQFTDKLAVISPAGLVLALNRSRPGFDLRWTSGIYADFAMVNSLPYNRFTALSDNSGVKTTLLNWGYYYALGTTVSSNLELSYGRWQLSGRLKWQSYRSIQGLDRYQYTGLITEDFKLGDTWFRWKFRLVYRLGTSPVELGLTAENIYRHGWLLTLTNHYSEYRYCYQIGLRL